MRAGRSMKGKHLYNKTVFTAAVLLSAATAFGQRNFGIATGNYSTFNSLYLNPASIADSREKLSVNLFSISAGIDNNLGYINNKGGVIGAVADGNASFQYSNASQSSIVAPYAEARLPGFIWNINHRHSVALTTGVRGMNQFNNFNQSLYRVITDPDYVTTNDIDLTSRRFNYTAHLWSQIGLTYAGVILDQGNHVLKAGATVRYLGGVGYIGLRGRNLDAHFRDGNDSFYASNSDIEYASNVLSTRSAMVNGFSNNSILSEFFGEKAGHGIGGDIGIVYDYIPNPERRRFNMDGREGVVDGSADRYLLRISASVTDLGAINYSSSDNSNARVSGNGYLTGQGLRDNVTSYDGFRNYVIRQGFRADTVRSSTKVYMPTSLLFGVDYHAYKGWYVNATFAGNLANRDNFGNSYYSQVTVTPRYDTRLFSVGLPITYNTLSRSARLGLGARFTGFFIGSDDILALFSGRQYGFNFYVGGCVPLYKHGIKDRDGDRVSDRKDRCPEEYGTWENRGCPEEGKEKRKRSEDDKDKEQENEE
jgi:hypothetical protein